ncbi:MAG TPA: MauE/DoxX family redox-associated membrane protein [Geobacteraceae bacterium]|nr:MauE/DoxX family redox-associated membrane protein [Geobacteraceae bacterium]
MKKGIGKYFPVVVRIGLGLVFVYAGILKIMDPVAFAGSVAAYKILPYNLNYLVAAILPWVETTCGALLIVGCRVKAASCIIIAMNLVFMAALASTIVRGLNVDCGCFRQGGDKTPAWVAILRDVAFLAAAIFLARLPEKRPRFFNSSNPE